MLSIGHYARGANQYKTEEQRKGFLCIVANHTKPEYMIERFWSTFNIEQVDVTSFDNQYNEPKLIDDIMSLPRDGASIRVCYPKFKLPNEQYNYIKFAETFQKEIIAKFGGRVCAIASPCLK